MEESRVPPGVCECYPWFLRPCSPFGRPCLMAGPVLSVAARAPSRSAPPGGSAPAASRKVSTVARDARWALLSASPSCSRLPPCCGCLLRLRLLRRREGLLRLRLLLRGDLVGKHTVHPRARDPAPRVITYPGGSRAVLHASLE